MALLNEQMKQKLLAFEVPPATIEIEKSMIRRYADAVGDQNPRWLDGVMEVPPGMFHTIMMIGQSPDILFQLLKLPVSRALDGGGEWEYFAPTRPRDVLTVATRVSDLYEREGASGPMVFIIVESTWKNQRGELLARCHVTVIVLELPAKRPKLWLVTLDRLRARWVASFKMPYTSPDLAGSSALGRLQVSKQLFFEDVYVGMELPNLVRRPTPMQLVKWAGASEDYEPIHYNQAAAQERGLPDIIVHGRLKSAFLCQMISDWAGKDGKLLAISCQHRGIDLPGKDLTCRGKVTEKYSKDERNVVACEVCVENEQGQKTVPGTARISLPSRSIPQA